MIIKPYRSNPMVRTFTVLFPRMEMDDDDIQYFTNLQKGDEGERRFAELLKEITDNWLVLHDLLLEQNGTLFQIDTLLISQKLIYVFDVKYHQGDYYLESGNWHSLSGTEVKNPLLQLIRCESLLRQFLQRNGFNLPIKGLVVFNHSEFTLYQAPTDIPVVFPTQVNRLIKQLRATTSKPGKLQYRLAEKLMDSQIEDNKFDRIPTYQYERLKKGIDCASCRSMESFSNGMQIECRDCGHKEPVDQAVLRSVNGFRILFPNKKVTISNIQDWCGIIHSKKTIRRILAKNFALQGFGRASHYVERGPENQ